MLVKSIERVKMTKGQKAGDGPIAVEVEQDKSYYWCACGLSKKQPFCDGSHNGTEFKPLLRILNLTFLLLYKVNKILIFHLPPKK